MSNSPARIHHINLVVDDADLAASQFAGLLGVAPGPAEHLTARGVRLRRFNLDGVWLVLLSPETTESPAAQWLAAHGPGLFLLSFDAGALEDRLAELARHGIDAVSPPRRGLDAWRVVDLDPAAFSGLPVQLTEHLTHAQNGDQQHD